MNVIKVSKSKQQSSQIFVDKSQKFEQHFVNPNGILMNSSSPKGVDIAVFECLLWLLEFGSMSNNQIQFWENFGSL